MDGSPEPRAEFFSDRRKIFVKMSGGVALIATGGFLMKVGPLPVQAIGAVSVIFFSLCMSYGVGLLLARGPALIVDATGITDRGGGFGHIPWSAIRTIGTWGYESSVFLTLSTRDNAAYLARLSFFKRKLAEKNDSMGIDAVTINVSDFTVAAPKVLALIIETAKDAENSIRVKVKKKALDENDDPD